MGLVATILFFSYFWVILDTWVGTSSLRHLRLQGIIVGSQRSLWLQLMSQGCAFLCSFGVISGLRTLRPVQNCIFKGFELPYQRYSLMNKFAFGIGLRHMQSESLSG